MMHDSSFFLVPLLPLSLRRLAILKVSYDVLFFVSISTSCSSFSLSNNPTFSVLLQFTSFHATTPRHSPHQHSIVYILSTMSQSGTSSYDSSSKGLNCNNCGRFAKFEPCKTNQNGNKGVLFATVRLFLPVHVTMLNYPYDSVIKVTRKENHVTSSGGHLNRRARRLLSSPTIPLLVLHLWFLWSPPLTPP